MTYEFCVIGLQLVGGAVACQLSKRTNMIIAFDQDFPPHDRGSSHGKAKIYRLGTGEGSLYGPYAQRSYHNFRELEAKTGRTILVSTGVLIIGSASENSKIHGSEDFLGSTVSTANELGIDYKLFDAKETRRMFPQFNLSGDEIGYFEPGAGYIKPENCIQAQLELAARKGVEIHKGEKVLEVVPKPGDGEVTIRSELRTYSAKKVIITAGPWISGFLPPRYASLFEVHRQIQCWFDVRKNFDKLKNTPVFIRALSDDFIYGFPPIDGPNGGMKIASENIELVDPDRMNTKVSTEEIMALYHGKIKNFLPDVGSFCTEASTCKYTKTSDRQFIIDQHPEFEQVFICSADCGHGAKHSQATGEAVAELALYGKTTLDISPFSFSRFQI